MINTRFVSRGSAFFCCAALLLSITSVASARTDCPAARVVNIQIEYNYVHYQQEGAPWRHLGVLTNPGVRERLAALLAAQMAGKAVLVAYEGSQYNCALGDYSTPAIIVRTTN
jgi:hypothetical protein